MVMSLCLGLHHLLWVVVVGRHGRGRRGSPALESRRRLSLGIDDERVWMIEAQVALLERKARDEVSLLVLGGPVVKGMGS